MKWRNPYGFYLKVLCQDSVQESKVTPTAAILDDVTFQRGLLSSVWSSLRCSSFYLFLQFPPIAYKLEKTWRYWLNEASKRWTVSEFYCPTKGKPHALVESLCAVGTRAGSPSLSQWLDCIWFHSTNTKSESQEGQFFFPVSLGAWQNSSSSLAEHRAWVIFPWDCVICWRDNLSWASPFGHPEIKTLKNRKGFMIVPN